MSKLVKQLMMDDLQSRLQGVGDVFVVSLGQLDAQKTTNLRLTLRKKNISLRFSIALNCIEEIDCFDLSIVNIEKRKKIL